MTTKKRITLTVSAICLLLVFGIVSIFAVFSATKNTTTSNVTVTYTATEISGTVSASYAIKSDSSWTAMTDANGKTEIDFSQNKGQEMTTTLAPSGNITVTAVNTYAIFKYKFTNNSTANQINLALGSGVGTPTNFAVKYYTSATEDLTVGNAYNALKGENVSDSFTSMTVGTKSGSSVGTVYVYVLVELQNDLIDASFTGNYVWSLTKGAAA